MKHYSFCWSYQMNFLASVDLARFAAEPELVVCPPPLGTQIWEHYQKVAWTYSSKLPTLELELHLHSANLSALYQIVREKKISASVRAINYQIIRLLPWSLEWQKLEEPVLGPERTFLKLQQLHWTLQTGKDRSSYSVQKRLPLCKKWLKLIIRANIFTKT